MPPMSSRWRILVFTTLLVAFLAPYPARAQDEDDEPPRGPGRAVELEVHGGGLRFDGEGSRLSYGGRATLRLPGGIGIGGSATMAKRPFDDDITGDETEEADAAFYTVDLSYMLESVTRANFFATVGAGIARFDPPPSYRALGVEEKDELVIPLGLGILWYNHPGGGWLGIRTELRDNIVFLNGDERLGTDDAIANNWELSVGLSLLFGAYD
jgi:hypothetical protein